MTNNPYVVIWFVTYHCGADFMSNAFEDELRALRHAANLYPVPNYKNVRVFNMHVEIRK